MRTQTIKFSGGSASCAFPEKMGDLAKAISLLRLETHYPVLVLIGGNIPDEHLAVTQRAIEAVAQTVEELRALIICGGTAMGVMALIGEVRAQHKYRFPLIGIAPESLVKWPGAARSFHFLRWGRKKYDLASGYSHFILTPGSQFGDESPWITNAARYLSHGSRSVTVLMNGGRIARLDLELSLKEDRPVIAVAGTGRLADELAESQPALVKVVTADGEESIGFIRSFLANQNSPGM